MSDDFHLNGGINKELSVLEYRQSSQKLIYHFTNQK
jgi:hypothetical protein